MRIGFLTKYDANIVRQPVGEELYARSLCRELLKLDGVTSAEVHTLGTLPGEPLDIMVHLNDTRPGSFAARHVLYMQNFYPYGSDQALRGLHRLGFDGYAFFSERLLEFHQSLGFEGIFLPLAADTDIFRPILTNPQHQYDVVYVGNDIKSPDRTLLYLYPAIRFRLGLFGNWKRPENPEPWKKRLAGFSRGPVPRETAASLFSSARICLNYTDTDSVVWDAMNLRFYEVLACKGFLISDRVPSAEKLLAGGAVFTDGGQDLTDKLHHYLGRPDERARIAEEGYQYVLRNATVQLRAVELLEYLRVVLDQPARQRR